MRGLGQYAPKKTGIMAKYDEAFGPYFNQVSEEFPNIPYEAFYDWIYDFWHSHVELLYGGLDFRNLRFARETWTTDECLKVDWYRHFDRVQTVEAGTPEDVLEAYQWIPGVNERWEASGTWTSPIWILAAGEFDKKLLHSDVHRPFMLIEGHSRLGALRSFHREGRAGRSHEVWVVHTA